MNDIQKTILALFKQVRTVLENNSIPYYALGGTCLGAVRHHGFIPWDDDLDILVPIEEYDRMHECLRRELPDKFEVITHEKAGHYVNLFTKVIDAETTFIEKMEYDYKDAYKGVFVDIMPLSGLPKRNFLKKYYYFKVRLYRVLNSIRRFPRDYQESKWQKKLWTILRRFDKWIPENYYAKKWMGFLRKHPVKNSECVAYAWWWRVKEWTFNQEAFSDAVELPFEDTTMKCPKGWDECLKGQFGNYMQLPPVSERVRVHSGTIDLEHSYTEYISGRLQLHTD